MIRSIALLAVLTLSTMATAQDRPTLGELERVNQYQGDGVTASGSYFYDLDQRPRTGFGYWRAPPLKTLEAIQVVQFPIAKEAGEAFVWAVPKVEKFDANSEYKFFKTKKDAVKYARQLLDAWPLPKSYKSKHHYVYNLTISPGKYDAVTSVGGPKRPSSEINQHVDLRKP